MPILLRAAVRQIAPLPQAKRRCGFAFRGSNLSWSQAYHQHHKVPFEERGIRQCFKAIEIGRAHV